MSDKKTVTKYRQAIHRAQPDKRAKAVLKETRRQDPNVQIAELDNTLRRLKKRK